MDDVASVTAASVDLDVGHLGQRTAQSVHRVAQMQRGESCIDA